MISTFEMISSFSRLKNQIIIDIIYLSVLKADGNNYFLLEIYHIQKIHTKTKLFKHHGSKCGEALNRVCLWKSKFTQKKS